MIVSTLEPSRTMAASVKLVTVGDSVTPVTVAPALICRLPPLTVRLDALAPE